jgi:hypothetical protein
VSLTGAAATAVIGASGYTVDMRLQWVAGCIGSGAQKTMGFSGNAGNGRGIRIDSDSISIVSSGVVSTGSIDMTQFQTLRIIVQTNGHADIYSNLLGGFPDPYVLVVSTEAAPGTTGVPGATGGPPVVSLGDYSGVGTTLTSVNYDYVRIGQNTDPQAVPYIESEPATLVLLALGGIPMMIRRGIA